MADDPNDDTTKPAQLSRLGDAALTKMIGYTFHDELKNFAELDDQTKSDDHIYKSIRLVALETNWISEENLAREEADHGVKLPIRRAVAPDVERSELLGMSLPSFAAAARDSNQHTLPLEPSAPERSDAMMTDKTSKPLPEYAVFYVIDRTYSSHVVARSPASAEKIVANYLAQHGAPLPDGSLENLEANVVYGETTRVSSPERSRFSELVAKGGEMTDRKQGAAAKDNAAEATETMARKGSDGMGKRKADRDITE